MPGGLARNYVADNACGAAGERARCLSVAVVQWCVCVAWASQGLSAWHGHRNVHGSAAFLQRRAQTGEGDGVKVSVAGVSQPGKSVHKRVNRLASKWFARSLFRRLSCFCLRHSVLEDCRRRQGLRICCPRPRPGFWWLAQAAAGTRACSCSHCQSRSRLACQFSRVIRLRCSKLLTWHCTVLSARRARQRLLSCLVPAAQAPRCWPRSAFVLAGFFATCLRLPDRREAFRRRRRLVLQSWRAHVAATPFAFACMHPAGQFQVRSFWTSRTSRVTTLRRRAVLFSWRFCALLCLASGVEQACSRIASSFASVAKAWLFSC